MPLAVGSRQDLTLEGSLALYMNCPFYLEFLFDEMITTPENILMKTMMHILVSSEMIAMTRVYVILHLSISLPMQFLAGKSHEF